MIFVLFFCSVTGPEKSGLVVLARKVTEVMHYSLYFSEVLVCLAFDSKRSTPIA